MPKNTIPIFYWSERKFSSRQEENYGDLLSKYLVEKLSGKSVSFVHPKKQNRFRFNKKHFLLVGSILHHATKHSIVWGSGIIDRAHAVSNANFLAVRGPETRKYLLESGYNCPAVYGDPALLLPRLYKPNVKKKYKIGVIPHYKDLQRATKLFKDIPQVKVINLLTLDVEKTTCEILSCETTLSSSLHGIIVSHAYDIPSVQVEFSKEIFGDGIKYRDYYASVGMDYSKPEMLEEIEDLKQLDKLIDKSANLPEAGKIYLLQKGLLENCPFEVRKEMVLNRV